MAESGNLQLQPSSFLTRAVRAGCLRDAGPCQAAARLLQESLVLYGFRSWDSHEFAAAICQQLQPVRMEGWVYCYSSCFFQREPLDLESHSRLMHGFFSQCTSISAAKKYDAADSVLALRQRTASIKGTMKRHCACDRCKWHLLAVSRLNKCRRSMRSSGSC